MKTRQLIICISLALLPLPLFSQLKTYSFASLDSLQKTATKNTLVFIYTDWCRYCGSMKNTTFKDKQVVQALNEQFWLVYFNAEEKQNVHFHGHTFRYQPTGHHTGIHELAEQLATVNGKVSYPTLCILNPDNEIIFQYNQFLSAEDLLKVLNAVQKTF